MEIAGCEWGFYMTEDSGIVVCLHNGEMDLSAAIEFVRRVKLCVFGEESARVLERVNNRTEDT